MNKKIKIVLIVLAAVFVLNFVIARSVASMVSAGVRKMTGFRVTIGNIGMNLFLGEFHVSQLRIFNPPDFQGTMLTDIPEIFLDFEWFDFFKSRKIHFKKVVVNLQEVNVVKNEVGTTNLAKIQAVLPKSERKEGTSKPSAAERAKQPMPLLIDEFELTLRNVRYVEIKEGKPVERTFDLEIEKQKFANVESPNVLVQIIILKMLQAKTLGKLDLGIDAGELYSQIQGVAGKGVEYAKETLKNVDVTKLEGDLKEGVGKASDSLKLFLKQSKKSLEQVAKEVR